ncbi:MAG: hypothetical protein WAL98_13540 [Desulfatiglandaceae bacterium]
MTKEDRGHYAKKHAPGEKANKEIAEAVKKRAVDGQMACALAFDIAADQGATPGQVGFALDVLEIRLTKCQLGLFGYGAKKKIIKTAETVPGELEESIRKGLTDDRLSCKAAWDIASTFGVGKLTVSSACETLAIKISPCQLGAF